MAEIIKQNETAKLKGELNFNSASYFLNQSRVLFANAKKEKLTFDFSDLSFIQNSIAIALIVEWIKLAKRYQVNLRLQNLSPSLLAIGKVSGLDEMIGSLI